MAGHSKWKNIQHRKGRQDAIRGKIFAKLAREIYVAARMGGIDPETNHSLRLAISRAKANNMPNDNIDRALKKAAGTQGGQEYERIVYEGYSPGGAAVLVETLTDNRNRTAADMRHLFSKRGGNLGEAGCVAWMFERKGRFTIKRDETGMDEEEVMLLAIELGAEDVVTTEEMFEITTSPELFLEVKSGLEQADLNLYEQEVTMVPESMILLSGDEAVKSIELMEALEEHDDVQQVYANFDLEDGELE
ncbi:YebC/PmpR family DNA-binding transcriptional regulator [Mechercharimyces sp. CAU 1602]|uniref:YebC/PmpR family DNA-binding transcriptional regulator n=1 Tax=Mechercharimyces sp. CAU 1602 TaxID=2973933 RepID=UPI00216238AB|nr:YebC/PmpR family DNA-binding transcriptional regulator [Mechercharimyces sp. CAU 1602]MCS1351421.1 YebC/PmpR family DNA-binding transcriptional regulator [Mechercharimyces sp. CAU 1602]